MEMQNENEQNLDNKVQSLLKDLTVPYNPDHWSQMSQRLEALDASDSSFDNLMRERLESTVPSFQASHWDLMNQKLDDLTDADADFDAKIKEQLTNVHRTYQPKHWDLMAERIEQEFSWKAKIMRYKVAEVALMLLVLFSVFNYFEHIGYENERGEFKMPEINKSEHKAEPKQFNRGTDWRMRENKKETKQQDNFNKQESTQPSIVSVENPENSGNGIQGFKGISIENNQQSAQNQAIVSSEIGVKANSNTLTENTQTEQIPILKASDIALVEKALNADDLVEKMSISKENVFAKDAITEGVASAQSLSVLRPNALTIAQMYDAPVMTQAEKKDKWWRLGIFGSNSVSNVSSSYVYKETKKWNFWALNKGIGLVVGFKKKKVEVETGIAYNSLRYEPGLPQSIIEGHIFQGDLYSPELTKEVTLGVVRVPINLNIDLKDKNRWHIYPMAGVSFNAAVNIDTVNFAPALLPQFSSSRNSKDKDFPKYGESFKIGEYTNNFYFTANIGLGVEYRLNPTHSVYIQPQYERQFGKAAIGSRGDRINSLTVQAGVKMRFRNAQ
jgi:hypothetical protein